MRARRLLAALAALATVLGIVAAGSAAAPGNTYLCYSKLQTDPGVWSDAPANAGGDVSAAALIAAGYWMPFAEKSVPTNTQLPGGWFLNCNPVSATTQSGGTTVLVGGAGETTTDASFASVPGYYPMAP